MEACCDVVNGLIPMPHSNLPVVATSRIPRPNWTTTRRQQVMTSDSIKDECSDPWLRRLMDGRDALDLMSRTALALDGRATIKNSGESTKGKPTFLDEVIYQQI